MIHRSQIRSLRKLAAASLCTLPLCLIVTQSLSSTALAQAAKGVITGHATDSAGAVLQGARVVLQPTGFSTASNTQGEFTFTDLAPGKYSVTVSYVGFSVFSRDVNVAAGQATRVEAALAVSTATEQVLVTTERQHGEAEAINRARTSDNILQVLPVEVITSLPNTNVADALGRLPSVTLERDEGEGKYVQIRGTEPRLSNVTVNGVNVPSPESGVRQIKLDVIPANLVDSVEINKTLSANLDGDAIGGSVNLVTKTAEERPTIYLNGTGGYTPIIGGRPLYEVDGTVGKRFLDSKRLGVLFGASWDWNGRGIDDVEPSPTTIQCDPGPTGCVSPTSNAPFVPTYSTQDIREYRYYRERYGFTGSIDYKLGDLSGLYARFLYSHFNNFGDRWVYSPTTNSTDTTSGWLTPNLTDGNGSMSFNAQIRRPVEVIGSLQLGGKHVWTRWVLAYDFSVSRSATEDKGYSTASFNGPSGIQFAIDTTNPLKPKFVPSGGFSSIYQPSTYTLANLDVGQTYSPQLNLQGGFSAAKNYNWAGHFGTFEFGGKLRNAHKFEDARDPVYDSVNAPAMTSFLGTFTNSNYYNGSYTLGPTVDYSKVRSYFNSHVSDPNFFTQDLASSAQNTYPNNYDLVERVSAGYLMNTLQFGRTRVQTGVRFEGTNENLMGNRVVFDANGFVTSVAPVTRNPSYLDVLPSVQFRFDLGHNTDVRASYSRGIARPNYSDLPPFFSINGSANEVDVGNPDLKPTRANNYDLLVEKYLQPLGLIQGGFFFKQLNDPIYSIRLNIDPNVVAEFPQYNLGNYIGNRLVLPVNGGNAHLWGLELSYIQHLTFLPGLLSGLGFSGNYSYTNSTAHDVDPGRSDSPPLARQAPNSWNLSPTYDRGRLSVRVGISHNDANIFSYGFEDGAALGKTGPNGDTYLYAHTQVDAQGSFRMYRGLQLVISGLNLTNEVFGFYNGSSVYPIQREFYKPTYSFGLRYTLSNEPN